jgi:hypothetical protein
MGNVVETTETSSPGVTTPATGESASKSKNKNNNLLAKKSSQLMDALVDDIRNGGNGVSGAPEKGGVPSENAQKRKKKFENLLEEEIAIRKQIRSMPGAQGRGGMFYVVGSTCVNMISAFLVFAMYLISLESLLSIGLCVGLTMCKS